MTIRCRPTLLLRAMVAATVLLSSGVGWAQDVPGYPPLNPATLLQGPYDKRELALLPKYCFHTQIFRQFAPGGSDKQEIDRWYAALGDTYHHLHHYCWGMMKTNRAVLLARDPKVKNFFLNDALGEFDYVIERAPSNFVLLPEILTKKAENLLLLDRAPLAVNALEHAIEVKPDYWPPYAKLADHYKDSGDLERARKTLQSGLAANPNAAALSRRLEALGSGTRR